MKSQPLPPTERSGASLAMWSTLAAARELSPEARLLAKKAVA
jgi:hypothetical protein